MVLFVLDSKEFEDFNGFFKIIKTPNLNKLKMHQYETNIFGIKSDRKELTVEKLYLNPEDDINIPEGL